jgi:putative restriction endonuclease
MNHIPFDRGIDTRVRAAAFEWLASLVRQHGDALPRKDLEKGFVLDGRQIFVIGPQGIFKPSLLQVPLSITTSPNGPYDDAFSQDGLLQYRYRGTDPLHPDNAGLRFAMQQRLPLVYFHGLVPGKYAALWPVYIVRDQPNQHTFSVAVDDIEYVGPLSSNFLSVAEGGQARREYITTVARRRLHQSAFRERVLRAYRHQCALCRLRHDELLDAAHIIPDSEEKGEPIIQNGLAMCRLHHAAFDRYFLSVRPDYKIEVRADVLEEEDGPTLKHAIQALHEKHIWLPRSAKDRPGVDLLTLRYEQFLTLGKVG